MKNSDLAEALAEQSISFFEKYNEDYDKDDWLKHSEARKFNLTAIRNWISIRDGYTFVEERTPGKWQHIDIKESHSKYGTNYIFIEPVAKLWRIKESAGEFYGSIGEPFEF